MLMSTTEGKGGVEVKVGCVWSRWRWWWQGIRMALLCQHHLQALSL